MFARIKYSLLPLGLVALVASTAWAITADQVAKRITNKINSKWQTTALSVKVVPYDDTETNKGRFRQIDVTARAVIVRDVKLSPISISATDVTLDLDKLVRENQVVSTRRRAGHFSTHVSERDLNLALAHKKTPIQNLACQLGVGTITFTGTYKLGLGANLKLEGRLECPDHYQVNFIPTRAAVSGVPLPAGPLKTVLSKLNPLLDLRKIPMSPRIERLIVTPSGISMSG